MGKQRDKTETRKFWAYVVGTIATLLFLLSGCSIARKGILENQLPNIDVKAKLTNPNPPEQPKPVEKITEPKRREELNPNLQGTDPLIRGVINTKRLVNRTD